MAEDLSQQERDLIANLIRDGKPVPARYIPSITDSYLLKILIVVRFIYEITPLYHPDAKGYVGGK